MNISSDLQSYLPINIINFRTSGPHNTQEWSNKRKKKINTSSKSLSSNENEGVKFFSVQETKDANFVF